LIVRTYQMALEVSTEDLNIYDIIENSDLTSDLKKKLKISELILLPASFSTNHQKGDFPAETPNLLRFMRVEHPEIEVALFENIGEEKTQALHSADIILPTIYHLIEVVAFPTIVYILCSYLDDKLKGDPDSDKKTVKLDIYSEYNNPKKITRINYEGPLSGVSEIKDLVGFELKK